MSEIEIIKNALLLSEQRLKKFPDFVLFESINEQLNYLLKVADGRITNRSKLKNINIGLYAIKEFDESDPELSEALKHAQFLSDRMAKGLKIDA